VTVHSPVNELARSREGFSFHSSATAVEAEDNCASTCSEDTDDQAIYERMSEDLHLAGVSKRTHQAYLRAVRKLADYWKTSPDKIAEQQLREYFLILKNSSLVAWALLPEVLRVCFQERKNDGQECPSYKRQKQTEDPLAKQSGFISSLAPP